MATSKPAFGYFWPTINNEESAREAAKQGVWAAVIVAVITSIFAGLSLMGTDALNITSYAFVDAFLFALIAWGISKLSRFAAVSGLVLYLLERLMSLEVANAGTFIVAIFFVMAFVNAVRGTYYYRNMHATGEAKKSKKKK